MPAHTLVLLRHGKSDWSGLEPDDERPLTRRGVRQTAEAGAWLATHQQVDLAVVSPAVRAQQSWEQAAAELGTVPATRPDDRVYAAVGNHLLEVVRELPEEVACAVIVGHNPGLEDLVATLTGEWLTLKTAALAVIDLEMAWSGVAEGSGRLRTHGRPPQD